MAESVAPEALRLLQVIRQGPRHRVSLVADDRGALRVHKQSCTRSIAAARFRLQREYRMLRTLAALRCRFVVQPLDWQPDAAEPTLVLAWHDGAPLDTLAPAPLADLLEIAQQAALALQDIHRAGIVHLDISSANLVWNGAARQLTVVDFSSAMLLQGEESAGGAARPLEGTLPFMAPEQTGLMDRPVDNRSDLYSLGITLYRLAAGVGPFDAGDAGDALGWAHAHMTARPTPLAQHRPELPAALCAIVHRLIEKAPEQRYQTAWGLAHDLERARIEPGAVPGGSTWALGERDVSDRLNTNPALCGRSAEQRTLHAAWQRCAGGATEVALVGGDAGAGKTALANDLRRAVLASGGVFLYGKFDSLQPAAPFSAISAALNVWIDHRLAEPEAVRAHWRVALAGALVGHDRAALYELLPRLRELGGSTTPGAAPAGQAAHADHADHAEQDERERSRRLLAAVGALVRAACSAAQPMLWVVDDVQWADAASATLLESVFAAPPPRHLMLVALHRPAEAGATEPACVAGLRRACARSGVPAHTIALTPLDRAGSAALLHELLGAPIDEAEAFERTVHERTLGNAFGVVALLNHLRAAGGLVFDPQRLRWAWSAQTLADLAPDDGSVDLVLRRSTQLAPRTLELLALGACIGREFDLADLLLLADGGAGGDAATDPAADLEADLEAALEPACAAMFVVKRVVERGDDGGGSLVYRFVHDRVQEAAYALFDAARRRDVHRRIGQALLARSPEGDALFAAVNQLDRGHDSAEGEAAREQLAALNLRAMQLAAGRGAPAQALGYGEFALSLKPAHAPVRHQLLIFVHWLCCMLARRQQADVHYAALLADSPPVHEMMHTHRRQMLRLQTDQPDEVAIGVGLAYLGQLGVAVDLEPDDTRIRQMYRQYLDAWARGEYERLLHEAPVADPKRVAAARTLSMIAFACEAKPRQLHALALQALALVREQGIPAVSWELPDQVRRLHRELGDDLRRPLDEWPFWEEAIRRNGPATSFAQARRAFAVHVLPWNAPLGRVLAMIRESIEVQGPGRHFGSLTTDLYHACICRFALGDALADVEQDAQQAVEAAERNGAEYLIVVMKVLRQQARVLQARTSGRWSWDDETFRRADVFATRRSHFYTELNFWLGELELAVLANLPQRAAQAAAEAEPILYELEGRLPTGTFVYHAAMAEAMQPAPDRAKIAERLALLERWAVTAPATFAAKAALVRAELQRIDGAVAQALDSYEAAARAADAQRCMPGAGLALERLARLCFAQGWHALGEGAFARARQAYERWGARAKVEALDEEAGVPALPGLATLESETTTHSTSGGSVDIEAISRASQAIAAELDYERLLSTLVHTLMLQSGADRAVLLLPIDGRLEPAAHASTAGVQAPAGALAWSVVRLAQGSGEAVLLGDPQNDSRFADDPYIESMHPQSLLCLPVQRQDALLGIVYFENRDTAHAFSRQRLRVLQILLGHVIGALDNARLVRDLRASHDQLEQRVRERTRELDDARRIAEDATRAKGDFLANMSHEIRTPMNAILGMTHLALRSGLDARQRGYVSKAERAARSLLALINDILDLSKIEADRLELERAPFSPAQLIDELVDLVAERAAEKGLELIVDAAPDLPAQAIGDALRLRQVLLNLLSNAIKFTDRGAVSLRIGLVPDGAGATLHAQVIDTGAGMSEAQQALLFQPFVQADTSISRRFGGTGLGLAIARRLVELMGGEIGVHSAPGEGSTFWFDARLDAAPASADPAVVASSSSSASASASAAARAALHGKRVLIVDDHDGARAALLQAARGLGLDAEGAIDGWDAQRASALAAAAQRPFDLVLIDQRMPGMDGSECAAELRASGSHGARPILLMALGDPGLISNGSNGSNGSAKLGWIAKPVRPWQLEAACRAALFGTPAHDDVAGAAPAGADDSGGAARWHGARLLLVEDNEINQELAVELLGGAGLHVTVASDGRQAIDLLQQQDFDAVLMDVQMPVLDGYEATREIRRSPRWEALPIIAMTANAMAGDREKAIASGMNDQITKPLDIDTMFATIARWVAPG